MFSLFCVFFYDDPSTYLSTRKRYENCKYITEKQNEATWEQKPLQNLDLRMRTKTPKKS